MTPIETSNDNQYLKPRLRLFLSVDLVGSTALKQRPGHLPVSAPASEESLDSVGAKWIADLASFYRNMGTHFQKAWLAYQETNLQGWPKDHSASLWKINGDEIIYVADLESAKHCLALTYVWMQACLSYREELKKQRNTLDVKISAWTAGFPLQNTEVIFLRDWAGDYDDWDPLPLHYFRLKEWYRASPEERSERFTRDFIGPSIDTGFRLSALASARKFSISVDLIQILVSVSPPHGKFELKFGYDGMVALKGVTDGKPYPHFWIDTYHEDKFATAQDVLENRSKLEVGKIKTFCAAFFEQNIKYFICPFIIGDGDLPEIPLHYKERLASIEQACERAFTNHKDYNKSQAIIVTGSANVNDISFP
jgi:hypothetical protein